ncbi:hypothetical protein SAMN05192530_11839 [Aureimonas jatrophae]|uniref:Uncharacterized protein n=2 Tax=Aureimonas jatrophae TaxID=1166073 RepID=A0A1H0N9F0_9HYPH|nr:hypothetical protein SAMN05192530_11839 [Aureimonas jatrophae]
MLTAAMVGPAIALVDATIGTCTIVVVSPGTLTASTDLRSLSSTNAGGQAARVSVTTLLNGGVPQATCSLAVQVNCFRVTFVPPTSFAFAPAGADASVQFAGRIQPQGGTALLDLLSAVVLMGTQTIDLSLSATKTAGVFTAGTYQAQPTIRCE